MEAPGSLRAAATSPHMQVGSPLMNVGSPHMQAPSPHLQVQPSHMQAPSPHMQAQSPHMQVPSPHMQASSPHMQAPSPHLQMMSPTSVTHPGMMPGNLMQQQMQQLQPQPGQGAEPSGELSLTTLLGAGGGAMAFDSAELAGLAFLERGLDLSDSLNRLSTTDLYQ